MKIGQRLSKTRNKFGITVVNRKPKVKKDEESPESSQDEDDIQPMEDPEETFLK